MPGLNSEQANVGQQTHWGLLQRFWRQLSLQRRRQVRWLLVLMSVSAFAEVISLGAVIPFLGVLAAPEMVFNNAMIAGGARALGIASPKELALPITIVFVALTLASAGIRMFLLWFSTRLTSATSADFCLEAYRRTLYQPFLVHTSRNTSEVIGIVVFNANAAAAMLQHIMMLFGSILLIVAILSALLVINPTVALIAGFGFGASYAVITRFFRKRLRANSELIARESTQTIKALQEGLGAIRDVLLDGTQELYCDIYRRADRPLKLAQGNNTFIGGSPRFVMEALGMLLIASLAYYLSYDGGIASALPVLGALALGAQRLLPALQQSYVAWAQISSNQAYLISTLDLLEQPQPTNVHQSAVQPQVLHNVIQFDAVKFRYADDGPWILDGVDLLIPKGGRVGLVGSTGSGKSTMLDLLMALADPTQGRILVDGQPINDERRQAWQRTIAHVPQSIYLSDNTFSENIAFGVAKDEIDLEKVKRAAKQARIHSFIEAHPEGYNALVGERGIRISGGQRQRIGIARALYKNATVLVFDEATSALDNSTEQEVMDAIEALNRDLTIVIVAHRLSTVKRCDKIVELSGGKVIAQGSYESLLEQSPSFRSMAMVVKD